MASQTRPFIGINADYVPAGKQTSAHLRLHVSADPEPAVATATATAVTAVRAARANTRYTAITVPTHRRA